MTQATASAPTRVYKDYARPLWRRLLLTREAANIALLVIVYVVAALSVRNSAAPITITGVLDPVYSVNARNRAANIKCRVFRLYVAT